MRVKVYMTRGKSGSFEKNNEGRQRERKREREDKVEMKSRV